MKNKDLAWWLVENAGPTIRYRTLREILEVRDLKLISDVLERLFDSTLVQKWLERLVPRMGFHAFHSSDPYAFENAVGKLVQLGLHAGLQQFDTKTIQFRTWLAESIVKDESEDVGPWNGFSELLLASFLAYAGYGNTTPVKSITLERLKIASEFARDFDPDEIYVKDSKKEWLVKPQFYSDIPWGLPLVHDIRGFANSSWILEDKIYRERVENVVSVILTQEYQKLKQGYGYLKHGSTYYSIGWSVHVPNFLSSPAENEMSKLLLSLEIMAPFDTARESKWFSSSLKLLEDTQTEEGHYRFPSKWLPEKPSGYWDGGHYMALEDDRRKRASIDYESTFRMLQIRKIAGVF
ncbi:MAG: hypothetical protein ACXAEF_03160 [Candidatus Thorarchaeota archaeon]|jgi:hypothetical protein